MKEENKSEIWGNLKTYIVFGSPVFALIIIVPVYVLSRLYIWLDISWLYVPIWLSLPLSLSACGIHISKYTRKVSIATVGILTFLKKPTSITLKTGVHYILSPLFDIIEVSTKPIIEKIGEDGNLEFMAINGEEEKNTTTETISTGESPQKSGGVLMKAKVLLDYRVIPENARLTLEIDKKDLNTLVVEEVKGVLRVLGSVTDYLTLLKDQKSTNSSFVKKLEEGLEEDKEKDSEENTGEEEKKKTNIYQILGEFGYVLEKVALVKLTLADPEMQRAFEGFEREASERNRDLNEIQTYNLLIEEAKKKLPGCTDEQIIMHVHGVTGKAKTLSVFGNTNGMILNPDK